MSGRRQGVTLQFKGEIGKHAQEACRIRDRIHGDAEHLRMVGLTDIANRLHRDASEMAELAKAMYERVLSLRYGQ